MILLAEKFFNAGKVLTIVEYIVDILEIAEGVELLVVKLISLLQDT